MVPGPLSAMVTAGVPLSAEGPNWIEFALRRPENYRGLACMINFNNGSTKNMVFDQEGCLRIDSMAEVAGIHVEIPENSEDSDANLASQILNLIED